MYLQDLIQEERSFVPPRIILHGLHKIGKSTFGAASVKPIFIPTEDGLNKIKVPAFPLSESFGQVMNYINMLATEEHKYKTVVIDTLDWLERLIWEKVCKDKNVNNIEEIGYAKGYIFALSYWDKVISYLNKLRQQKNMMVILLAHSEVKTFSPPDGNAYDRWQIKLHHKSAAKLEEWVDAILFANYKVFVTKEGTKGKASGKQRVVYSQPNPAYRAGNRYGMPEELPFEFDTIFNSIKNSKSN
jgi:hypothetical protein